MLDGEKLHRVVERGGGVGTVSGRSRQVLLHGAILKRDTRGRIRVVAIREQCSRARVIRSTFRHRVLRVPLRRARRVAVIAKIRALGFAVPQRRDGRGDILGARTVREREHDADRRHHRGDAPG